MSLGLGIINSGLSSWQQGKANDEIRKKEGIIEAQNAKNEAIFNKQYYQDISKRTDVLNMMKMLKDNQDVQRSRDMAQAAVSGATAEQKLAAQNNRSKSFADAWSNVVSNASALKDQYLANGQKYMNQYYAQRLGMQDALAGINANASNQWSQAATNAFTSGSQMLGSGLDKIWKDAGN